MKENILRISLAGACIAVYFFFDYTGAGKDLLLIFLGFMLLMFFIFSLINPSMFFGKGESSNVDL